MRPTRHALLTALSPDARALLAAAEDAARALHVDLWLVGGGVRDLAAGRPLHDVDLAFEGDRRAYVDAIAVRLPEGTEIERTDRFGTASIHTASDHGGGARLDLARLRTERYVAPGALPEVRVAHSIESDLARRDFTVNAIALALVRDGATVEGDGTDGDDAIYDPFSGLADLAARRLRVLHDRSFIDDATRLWRGARTAALFDLEPDAHTARLIEDGARWTEEISGSRLWAEFAYTAGRGRILPTVQRLDAWGVLRAVHPAFCLTRQSATALRRRGPMPGGRLAAVLLAPLAGRDRHAILKRFQASSETRETVEDTACLLDAHTDLDTLIRIERAGPEALTAARWLDPERQPALQSALAKWKRTRPWLTADQLRAEGAPKGPALGDALRGLRRARYLGTLSTPAEARRHVRRVLAGEADWP